MRKLGALLGLAAAAALLQIQRVGPRSWRDPRPRRGYRIIHRLNRSQNWRRAESYKHARAISPFPGMPVR